MNIVNNYNESIENSNKCGESDNLWNFRVPTDLENLEKSGRKIVVREFNFPAKRQGMFFKCWLPYKFAVIIIDYRECLSR